MPTRHFHQDPLDRLRERNKQKRKELNEKYRANFSDGEGDIPPGVEAQWLKNVEEYERQHRNSSIIKVREYCGDLRFKAVNELPSGDVKGIILSPHPDCESLVYPKSRGYG